MPTLHFHGHATASLITDAGVRLMIDPFLDENPVADIRREDVEALDFILCTHGHADHFADCVDLARQTGAQVISTYEIVGFLNSQGVDNTHPLHIGGGHAFSFGYAKMTPALHGGQVHGDETGRFTTVPGGFWIDFGEATFHHAGDTALLTDMQLLRGRVDVAMLPIGDNFTMGPQDAVRAIEFMEPAIVVPCHYNTWELIHQDAHAFKESVGTRARVEIMAPGDRLDF